MTSRPNADFDQPTPGPWRVGPKNPDPDGLPEILIHAPHPSQDFYAVAAALPCCAGVLNQDLMPRMTAANARLIAASPALLAACQQAKTYLYADASEGTVARAVYDAICAAIAKALGENDAS